MEIRLSTVHYWAWDFYEQQLLLLPHSLHFFLGKLSACCDFELNVDDKIRYQNMEKRHNKMINNVSYLNAFI
jgi:hypothetical protein